MRMRHRVSRSRLARRAKRATAPIANRIRRRRRFGSETSPNKGVMIYREHSLVSAAVAVVATCLSVSSSPLAASAQQTPAGTAERKPASAAEARALLTRYCVTCHNDRLKTAGLALDSAAIDNVPAGAPVWERVVRKLRTGQMPPPGRPRPAAAQVQALATWLESEIDRDAAARPNPGRT